MNTRLLALCVLVLGAVLLLLPQSPAPVAAQRPDDSKSDVRGPVQTGVSPLLRSMPTSPAQNGERREVLLGRLRNRPSVLSVPLGTGPDVLLQNHVDRTSSQNMPVPLQNFEGDNQSVWMPPDTNGDIGYNASTKKKYYFQIINKSFQIWDVTSTPASVKGPVQANVFFGAGLGAPCNNESLIGDPIVLFDRFSNRWLLSLFGEYGWVDGYHQCIAVSQTADPTGAYYLYDYLISSTKFNDYPKFAVWPDAYYLSVILFGGGETGAVAFERAKMVNGDHSAKMVFVDTSQIVPKPRLGAMLPSNYSGLTAPPVGAPNYYVQFDDDVNGYPQDQLEVWQFHVSWSTPVTYSFTKTATLATAPFDSYLSDIPQRGAAQTLDVLSDRLMYPLQYRNSGGYETMVVNHTVDANDFANHAGIRWYELRKSGGAWSIYQQGTYAPDSNHRWMGSIAMDGQGNMALGYSVSSSTLYPSIRYAGRLVSDPLGTLPQLETSLIEGSGYQTGTNRWGDYSSMSVDPVDDCTFWYTNQYYTVSGMDWRTRIGSFKLCSAITPPAPAIPAPPPTPTPSASRQEDAYEPDDAMGLAHTITGKELHNFCGAKDEDWVEFAAKAGWTYHIKADPPTNFPTEPHLELYVNGDLVAQNDHYFGNIAEIWWWNNGPDQTAYVRVTELRGRGDCGSSTYTLSIEGFPDP